MRLAAFIDRDMQAILTAWDRFARTQLPAASTLDDIGLRDHAEEILTAVIQDLQTPQTAAEQARKSLGHAPRQAGLPHTAAETHGMLRAKWGFDIKQLVAEYRALRASVLSQWASACLPGGTHAEDTMRFNEAIDQAVAESVGFYSDRRTHERNLLLGALGHDMRSPLQVIRMSAATLAKADATDTVTKVAARIARSSQELAALLSDLVDFNRTNLGLGLSITPLPTDLDGLFRTLVDQLLAAHPGQSVEVEVAGDVQGRWDAQRLQQLLSNLVLNAFKYGLKQAPVGVIVTGAPGEVTLAVVNRGPRISPALLQNIFDPLIRGDRELPDAEKAASLGLGLYIARQIARAHGGDISVSSDDAQTTFAVRLPRLN